MPISVPKAFEKSLRQAIEAYERWIKTPEGKAAKSGVIQGAAGWAAKKPLDVGYAFISGHLKQNRVPHDVHDSESDIPKTGKSFWKP